MSLNGWYKVTYPDDLRLYHYVDDEQQLNITKNNASGVYTGYYMSNGIWVKYSSQDEMNTIWNAQFNGASPLPSGKPPN